MSRFMVAFLLACASAAAPAQQVEADAPRHDKEAVAILEKSDAVIESPRRAGLKDVTYVQTAGHLPGLVFDVKWMAPDRSKVELRVLDTAPEHAKTIAEQARDSLLVFARQSVDMVVGKENVVTYAKDDILLAGPTQVRIVARCERSKRLFVESLITFDGRGLPITMKSSTANATAEMQVMFEETGKLFRVHQITARGERESKLIFTYAETSGFTFPAKIRIEGDAPSTTFEFRDFRVNTGLKEDDFK